MKENTESRRVVEIRALPGDDRTITGTAIVFNTESQVLGRWDPFTEIIKAEAVTQDLINKSNIVMLWNHDDDMIPLARSKYGKGSLSITITATGVDFSFKARETPQGEEILAAVRAGDVDSCSFAFCVAEGGDEWFAKPDGGYLRTITKFEELSDFSLVNNPAYVEATLRSLDKFKESRNTPPADKGTPPADNDTPPADELPKDIADFYAPYETTITKFTE